MRARLNFHVTFVWKGKRGLKQKRKREEGVDTQGKPHDWSIPVYYLAVHFPSIKIVENFLSLSFLI